MSSKTKDKEKYLLQVSKKIEIAIGDRKATIAIAIVDLFSNGDRDRGRNFRDRGHALIISYFNQVKCSADLSAD